MNDESKTPEDELSVDDQEAQASVTDADETESEPGTSSKLEAGTITDSEPLDDLPQDEPAAPSSSAAKAQSRVVTPESIKSPASSKPAESTKPPAAVVAKQRSRKGVAVILIIAVASIFAIVFGQSSEAPMVTDPPSDPALEQAASGEGGDQAPSTVETGGPAQVGAEATPAPPLIPTQPTLTSGYLSAAQKQVNPTDSVTMYYPLIDRVEIGFYQTALTVEDKKLLLGLPSLADPKAPPALVVATIEFEPGTALCNLARITKFTMDTRIDPEKPVTFEFAKNTGGITELSCHLDRRGQLSANFAQSTAKNVTEVVEGFSEIRRIEGRWELRTSGPILYSRVPQSYQFSSEGRRPVAYWDKERALVEVGYFTAPLSESEYLQVRRTKSFLAVTGKQPFVTLTFDLKEGAALFNRESIRGYAINFYRNEEEKLRFPGDRDRLSFVYVPSSEISPALDRIAGPLEEGEQIHGQLQDSAPKKFDDIPYQFGWDIRFSSPLMDVLAEPIQTFAQGTTPVESVGPPKGTGGEVQVGKARLTLVDAVALFYPLENELAVAFYPTALTADERAQILVQKSVWNPVNGKQANFVVFFSLKPGATALSRDTLLGYRLVFVREKLGEFYFPGSSDRAVIKKLIEEITVAEVPYLGGSVKSGKNVALSLSGSYVSKVSNQVFTWKVDASPVVSVIE